MKTLLLQLIQTTDSALPSDETVDMITQSHVSGRQKKYTGLLYVSARMHPKQCRWYRKS